ncbi:MAG: class I adenylate-forming enzyme family protein [Sphingomonadales bacterium]
MTATATGQAAATPVTLGALLSARATAAPDHDAILFPGSRQSYGALHARARQHAKSLIALGVQPGDHVGLLLPARHAFIELLFGIALAGAVAVPINARYRGAELAYVTENADLVAVLTTGQVADGLNFVERLGEGLPSLSDTSQNPRALALAEAPKLRQIVLIGGKAESPFLSEAAFAEAATTVSDAALDARVSSVGADDLALILYTSGTTSNPKGCLIHHGGIVGNSRALAKRYGLNAADRFWSPLPIFHIAGILPMVAVMEAGGTFLAMHYFDAGIALDMLEREKVTATYPCFVTIIQDLVNHPRFAETDLSAVRLMNSSIAVQPPGLAKIVAEAMPHTIQLGTYGLSEAAGTVCTSRLDDDLDARTRSLGSPLEGWEVKIVAADSGTLCGPGERGEICIRGPHMLRGYYRDAQKTAEAIDPQGWLHTGDLGSLDEQGRIMFHGRLKDMLKVGGENVAAAEIEQFINAHPEVQLCQVVGIPHPRYQEVPAAFVELKAGARLSEAEIIDFCRGRIASFKVPRHVRFVQAWPMSASKIQKFKLREMLLAEQGAAPADAKAS